MPARRDDAVQRHHAHKEDEVTLLEQDGQEREDFEIEEGSHGHDAFRPAVSWFVLKLLYFLSGISASTWGRFGTIFYNEHGLTPYEIGTIEGLMTLVQSVASPVWGVIADKTRQRKRVTIFTNTACTCVLLSLSIPAVASAGYNAMIMVSCLMACFMPGSWLDAYTLDILGEQNKDKIGQFQLWCSLSWGLGAFLMGFLTDLFGFAVNFTVYAVLSFSSIAIVAWKIPAQTKLEKSVKSEDVRVSALLRPLMTPRALLFIVDMTVLGMGIAVVERLMFIFLLNDLKANTTLCGLTVGVTVLLELPIFHYSEVILRTMSHDAMLMVSMLAYIIRVYGYTLLTPETVWWILPLELLHGITFALSWIAGVKFMNSICPPEWVGTTQSILYTIYFCVGYGLGSVVGGYIMDSYGPVVLFTLAANGTGALFAFHAVLLAVTNLFASGTRK